MSTNKPTLDEASARKVARGQISVMVEKTAERIANTSTKFPAKRGAWLRAVEAGFRKGYKDNILTLVSEKRRVLVVYFLPLAEQYDGWLAVEASVATFGAEMRVFKISVISEHALARLMQGLRDCSLLDALRDQFLEWFLSTILACIASPNRPDILCVPTKSGYFTAKWDRMHSTFVYTDWQPDRLLTDKERTLLDRLRSEERLGLHADFGNCV